MVNEYNEMMCDLYRKYEISYCGCGGELKNETEQERGICRDCI